MYTLTRSNRTSLPTLQRQVNSIFDSFLDDFGAPATRRSDVAFYPRADVAETNDELVVTFDVPGIDAKQVEVSLDGDVLTVKGERALPTAEGITWHLAERLNGAFARAFRLTTPVVIDKIAADYKNGVLRISLPKAAEAKRHAIDVKVVEA